MIPYLAAMGHVVGTNPVLNEKRALFGPAQIIMGDPTNDVLRAGSDGMAH